MITLDKSEVKEIIAKRVALELKDGDVVNLGIGIPTLVTNYIPENIQIVIHSENGLLGMGPAAKPGEENENYLNAGGLHITAIPGAATVDSATSFLITRGGHVDVTVLGAMQVDEKGNLANWMIPGKLTPGMGGAMDLTVGAKKVVIAMEHTAKNAHKILKECTLPLTAKAQVNMIITEMGVMDVTAEGIILKEYNPVFTIKEIQEQTGAILIIPDDIKEMKGH
ncbi:MAG: 3-oxoacid CoA-transferase subunit B [Saprospiraceae bacterium]|nr:3-oxoacid CoA-transferase subunit B [Saprospiraceae bacterium]